MKNNCLIVLISIIISACSAPDSSQGVVSTQDLSTDTTLITIIEDVVEEDVVEENVVEENLSSEDAQLLLARCLRDNGYDVKDPKNDEGLRSVLTPIFIAADEKGRTELIETIQACAEENNIPLGDNAAFENPEDVADRLDTELEFAQCLREKGIEVEDPSADRPLRPILVGLVQSGQYLENQIREAAGECFDDLGLEPPQQGGG